jgi:hypothetical protein
MELKRCMLVAVALQIIMFLYAGNAAAQTTVAPFNTSGATITNLTASRLRTIPVAFGSLVTCASGTEGQTGTINDSTTSIWGAVAMGGGSNHVSVYCNGSTYVVTGGAFTGTPENPGIPGAVCDGKQTALSIAITSGSNTSNVGSLFTSADVGKTFFFFFRSGYGYGSTRSLWTATLTGYTYPTATWSANAPFNASSQFYYGTDNLAAIEAAMPTAGGPLTIPTGCGLLVNGTIPWNHSRTIMGGGGIIGRPGADVIATVDAAGNGVGGAGTGLSGLYIVNGTEVDWTLGYNLYAADGTLTIVPPVYRPLYDHSSIAPDPRAPGWLTGGKNGVASITQNSAVICTPNAETPPAVGQQIMFPYFTNIFTSSVSSTAGSCSSGFTARTMAGAFPNTSAYTSAQAEWFTGSAIQSTTTTIPTTITYPLTLNLTLSTNPVPGWISNFPQHGHVKLCGVEADYMGITATTITLRKGPASSAGCSGTTPMAVMNMCAAKNLFGNTSDQPWPVTPSINAGDSTPSGANWFPGECGGNFAIAFPTANGNTYVGAGLVGGFIEDIDFIGSADPGSNSGNANNAGSVLVQGNNAFFSSHVANLIGQNLQYGFVQGPASSGQHGVGAVGPTGIGNTFNNLWFFAAFPLSFVDLQSTDITDVNLNSTEISPFDGTAIGSATCIHMGYTLDEQTGGVITSTQFNSIHPYACEPENGSHIEVLPAADIEGSHITFDTANFEGIPNVFGGDHLKLANNNIMSFPVINYGFSNDFGVLTGNAMPYITNLWDGSAQFLDWGTNTNCLLQSSSGPSIPCVTRDRGSDPVRITPAMWNNNGSLDASPMTTTGAMDATATYSGSSATCALGGAAICHVGAFYGFNGYMFIGPWNQLSNIPYVLDATFKTLSAASSFTLLISAQDSGSGSCNTGGYTVVASETVTTTTAFGPAPPMAVDFSNSKGCTLGVQLYSGSTTDTVATDKFNLVPAPGYVRGPASAPTYPGSCPAGTPPNSWLGAFSGYTYFCDGGTVHRAAIT